MKPFQQILFSRFYKPLLELYLKTSSQVKIDGFRVKVFKGVFHPKLFFSSKYFYTFISKLEIRGLRFLEIGCGSGILSLLAHKKGAVVKCVDIDSLAVANCRHNFITNFGAEQVPEIYLSDVFENVPPQKFDLIIINPPYFFKQINDPKQYAWYCGEEGEFFEKLFSKLGDFISPQFKVYIILAANCELDRIQFIAQKHDFEFLLVEEKIIRWERNLIYSINKGSNV